MRWVRLGKRLVTCPREEYICGRRGIAAHSLGVVWIAFATDSLTTGAAPNHKSVYTP